MIPRLHNQISMSLAVVFAISCLLPGHSLGMSKTRTAPESRGSSIPAIKVEELAGEKYLVLYLDREPISASGALELDATFYPKGEVPSSQEPIRHHFKSQNYSVTPVRSDEQANDVATDLRLDGTLTKITIPIPPVYQGLIEAIEKDQYSFGRLKVGFSHEARIFERTFRPIRSEKFAEIPKSQLYELQHGTDELNSGKLLLPIKMIDLSSHTENSAPNKVSLVKRSFDQIWAQCNINLVIRAYRYTTTGTWRPPYDLESYGSPELVALLKNLSKIPEIALPAVIFGQPLASNQAVAQGFAVKKTFHQDYGFGALDSEIANLPAEFFFADSLTNGHEKTTAHEVGHIILDQFHDNEQDRLMSANGVGDKITENQCIKARQYIVDNFPQQEIADDIRISTRKYKPGPYQQEIPMEGMPNTKVISAR